MKKDVKAVLFEKGKDNIIWSIPTLEIKVTDECILKLNVRTFSSVKLKN